MFDPDTKIELPYPSRTSILHIDRAPVITRRVIVRVCRDLVTDPLTWQEFLRRPYVNRSRWLIRAWDVDLRAWRQFYVGTSPRYRSPGVLRLAISDPDEPGPLRWIGQQYEPTVVDRKRMIRVATRCIRDGVINPAHLRVIAVDLSIRSA